MKRLDLLAAAVLAVGGFGLAATPGFAQAADPAAQQPAAQPAAAQPADSAAAAAQAAGDRAASAVASESDVRQTLATTAQAILTKGGASSITQQFAMKDQDRLKDISKDASALDQSIEQLRQAYKEKYQKDLDLTASADQVFNSQFFKIGTAGDAARQASAQIGSDPSAANPSAGVSGTAGASGTASGQSGGAAASGAGASGTAGASATASPADQAITAASSAGQSASVTIPASHEMPETRLNIVKEGSSWKIDVPDSVDAQKLSQNLQTQLSQCTSMKEKWPADANEAARAISHSVFVALAEPSSGATGASSSSGAGAGSGTGTGTGTGTATPPDAGTNR
jgi:hypothetical protein